MKPFFFKIICILTLSITINSNALAVTIDCSTTPQEVTTTFSRFAKNTYSLSVTITGTAKTNDLKLKIDTLIQNGTKVLHIENLNIYPYSDNRKTLPSNCFNGIDSIFFPPLDIIPLGCFQNCTSLKYVKFSDIYSYSWMSYGPVTIQTSAFQGCTSLKEVIIPLQSIISPNAFEGCSALETVSIPHITTIAAYTFNGCTALTTVSLPAVTTADPTAFTGCNSISTINMEACTSGTPPSIAVISTTAISAITATSATSGGYISTSGSAPATARGVCWSTTVNPTVANNKTIDGSGLGTFVSSITGLSGFTTYHLRSYATTSVATVYGSDITFTTQNDVATNINNASLENQVQNVNVFPNPVKESFQISGLDETCKATLFDLNGKVLIERQLSSNENISVKSLTNGLYLLRIETSEGVVERKIVKK